MEGSTSFQIGRALQTGQAGQSEQSATTTVRVKSGAGSLELPGGGAFLRADFTREGFDLILDGGALGTVVVPDYFLRLSPPDLVTADGAVLPHHIVRTLAGPMTPGQVAQIGIGPAAAATDVVSGAPIGSVSESQGAVSVLHPNGTEAMLVTGDPIFQGDVLTTGSDGSLSVVFVDDTVFTLDNDGRMVMDEMVYDPGTETGTFNAMVVQGVFSFVSGKVAKTSPDAMMVSTPTATIGIRGSTVVGNAASEGSENKITLVRDVDGNIGEIIISNGTSTLVMNQDGASATVLSANAQIGPAQILSQQVIQQSYGGSLTRLVKTVAKQAEQKAEQANDKAQQSEADAKAAKSKADAAKAEAEKAKAEADKAEADAEAAIAEAEAAGDEQALADAKAQAAAAAEQKLAADNAAKAALAAEQQAAAAEVEAQQAAVEAQQAATFKSMASAALTVQIAAETAVKQDAAKTEADKADTAKKADTVTKGGGQDGDGQDGQGGDNTQPDPDLLLQLGPDPELGPMPMDLGLENQDQTLNQTLKGDPQDKKGGQEDEPSPPNNTPSVANVSASGTEDQTLTGTFTTTDVDGDALTYGLGSQATNGTVTVNANGSYSYTPNANYWGADSFTVTASDGKGGTSTSTVTVDVANVNDAPTISSVNILAGSTVGFTTGGGTTFDGLVANSFQAGASGLADLDNDGDLDIVMLGYDSVAGSSTSSTYVGLNDGSGNFTYSVAITNNQYLKRMDIDDVNGDGIADIVFAENSNTAQPIYFGDGSGGFTQSSQIISTTGGTIGANNVTLADFDGDGLADMWVNIDAGIKVFLNAQNGDAAGTFTDTGQSLTSTKTNQSYRGLAVGDIDGDGDIDAVTGTWAENMDIWVNDGTGAFSNTGVLGTGRLDTSAGASNGVDLGDLDGDGDLDIFVFNRYISNKVFLNDGTGTFTETQSVGTTGAREDGKLVDIDGDGDLDAIMAADAGMEVFLNDGNANFTATNLNIGSTWPTQVHGGDLNGDGSMDVLVANPGTTGSDILTNTLVSANAEVVRASSFTFQQTTFGVSDVDNPAPSSLIYIVESVTTKGDLLLSGTTLAVNDTFTQADINNGNVSYLNSGATASSDSFVFTVSDGQGGFIPMQTFSFSIMNTPINGTAGVDTLSGDVGVDIITGGGGADTLSGGSGADRFVYTSTSDAPGGGNETITDFDATDANEDIVLNGLLSGTFSYLGAGTFSATGNTEAIFDDTSKLLSIDANGNGTTDLEITLTGVATADLDVTDFTIG